MTTGTFLPEQLLRPNFKARAGMHVFGLVVAVALVVAGHSPPLLIAAGVIAVPVAFYQVRTCSVRGAWSVDLAYGVVFSYASGSAVGPAMIVGWSAVIGIVDVEHDWVYPVGGGVAAAAATVAMQRSFSMDLPTVAHASTVGATAALFVIIFRYIGGLLSSNEKELRAFFERVPVALTRTSPEGELLEYNRATAEMFRNPSVGESIVARYADPEQRRRFLDILARDGAVHSFEARMGTSPTETIEAVISANAVADDAGELRFIESAIFDFTPLRQLEVERERLARVIDATSDLISLANADGSIRYANSAARAWIRRHVTDEEYVHLAQPVAGDDAVMLAKALDEDGSWVGVLTVPGRQGTRTVSVSLQAIRMRGELTIASISRDVTTEIETEKQLKNLIRAKDELVASISHEIRTPLSVVLGLASEVRDNYDHFDPATHREFATLIAEQGQEMANIVEDLLVAARADTGSIVLAPEMVDVREEVEMSLRALPDQSRRLSVVNMASGACWADASRVRQILRNLISNAARYGGDRVTISTERHGDVMALAVADSGTGVSDDEVTTIFEPFGRAHTKGTQPSSIGLGLSVSRESGAPDGRRPRLQP